MNAPLPAKVVGPQVAPSILADLADAYWAHAVRDRGVLESSATAERPYLKRFFDWWDSPEAPAELFARIDADSVTRCLADYAAKYGTGSRRCMHKTVRLFLRFAYHAGYLERDLSSLSPSVHKPRMGKVARAIPPACIETLQNSIRGATPADLRDRAILSLLCTYGVRGVQVRRLRLEDVDWTRDRIRFAAAKRGREVEQHLTARAGNHVAEYLHKGRPRSTHREMFLHTQDPFGPITQPRALSKILRKRMEQAGLKLAEGLLYGSHTFRHAFATRMIGQVPFKDLVDMLGHRDPSTTLIYGKVDVAALSKAALPWPGGAR